MGVKRCVIKIPLIGWWAWEFLWEGEEEFEEFEGLNSHLLNLGIGAGIEWKFLINTRQAYLHS
jgi:hypothetical protein